MLITWNGLRLGEREPISKLSVSVNPVNLLAWPRLLDAPRYARIRRSRYMACRENVLILTNRAITHANARNTAAAATTHVVRVFFTNWRYSNQSPGTSPVNESSQFVRMASPARKITTKIAAASGKITPVSMELVSALVPCKWDLLLGLNPTRAVMMPPAPPAAANAERPQTGSLSAQIGASRTRL